MQSGKTSFELILRMRSIGGPYSIGGVVFWAFSAIEFLICAKKVPYEEVQVRRELDLHILIVHREPKHVQCFGWLVIDA